MRGDAGAGQPARRTSFGDVVLGIMQVAIFGWAAVFLLSVLGAFLGG